jgi:hypothetical protein
MILLLVDSAVFSIDFSDEPQDIWVEVRVDQILIQSMEPVDPNETVRWDEVLVLYV